MMKTNNVQNTLSNKGLIGEHNAQTLYVPCKQAIWR